MSKKILFITTSNLATNPRLVKEIQSLKKSDYRLEVLAFSLGNWGDDIDVEIRQKLNLSCHYLSAKRTPLALWLKWALMHKFYQLWSKVSQSIEIISYASNKRSIQLKSYLSRRNLDYDLIIAHNLGSLYPAFHASKKFNIPFQFDVEDYHPGELIPRASEKEKQRREKLMKELLPHARSISYASPLIKVEVERLVEMNLQTGLVINNSFWSNEFIQPKEADGPIKIVWFSQNISYGRGLELIVAVISEMKDEIELHLIGSKDDQFYQDFLFDQPNIFTHETMPQMKLHQFLANFDLGLALELNQTDLNRQICLTNKIFAYLQAGLYIIATDTPAQKNFIERNPQHGCTVGQSREELKAGLQSVIESIRSIRKEAVNRFQAAQKYNFENESERFLEMVKGAVK